MDAEAHITKVSDYQLRVDCRWKLFSMWLQMIKIPSQSLEAQKVQERLIGLHFRSSSIKAGFSK